MRPISGGGGDVELVVEVDPHAVGRRARDQRGEIGVGRLGLLDQLSGRRFAQHVQHRPQLVQRLVGGVADQRRLGPHLLGAQVVAEGERAGAHRHVRDAVGDDVVHLAGDPGAFGGTSLGGAQLLFGLGPFGALAEVPHQLAP